MPVAYEAHQEKASVNDAPPWLTVCEGSLQHFEVVVNWLSDSVIKLTALIKSMLHLNSSSFMRYDLFSGLPGACQRTC
jgi:hypothetical protein